LVFVVFPGLFSQGVSPFAEVIGPGTPSVKGLNATFAVPRWTSSLPTPMDDRLVLLAEGKASTVVRDEPGRLNFVPHWLHTPERRFFGAVGKEMGVEDGGEEIAASLRFLVGELVRDAFDSSDRFKGFPVPLPAIFVFASRLWCSASTSTTLGSFFTLTTFHPNPSLSAPHLSQHHLRAASGGRSRMSLIRAAWRADSCGARGWRRDGTAER